MSDAPDDVPFDPYVLLTEIVQRFPARRAGSADERGAQQHLAKELEAAGGEVQTLSFEWPPHLYAGLALNYGLGALGAALSKRYPAAGLLLTGLSAASAVTELSRKGLVLRRLLGAVASQNVLATFRAPGDPPGPKHRLVLLAHADSAYTGFIFRPEVLRATLRPLPAPLAFLHKQLRLPTVALGGLSALAALRLAGFGGRWLDVATILMALPPAIVAALNLEVVIRDEIVPGAADNVSGCVAVVALARRLASKLPPGTELVCVITGSEEAGTGGAWSLARDMEAVWPKDRTTVLSIDTMSNGDLVQLEEGELWRIPVPERLAEAIAETSAEPGMLSVRNFIIPAGATDALPFLARGYEAVGLTCIDPEIRAPRHYHHPTDTPENVDPQELLRSIDFAERLCLRLLKGKAGTSPE